MSEANRAAREKCLGRKPKPWARPTPKPERPTLTIQRQDGTTYTVEVPPLWQP